MSFAFLKKKRGVEGLKVKIISFSKEFSPRKKNGPWRIPLSGRRHLQGTPRGVDCIHGSWNLNDGRWHQPTNCRPRATASQSVSFSCGFFGSYHDLCVLHTYVEARNWWLSLVLQTKDPIKFMGEMEFVPTSRQPKHQSFLSPSRSLGNFREGLELSLSSTSHPLAAKAAVKAAWPGTEQLRDLFTTLKPQLILV